MHALSSSPNCNYSATDSMGTATKPSPQKVDQKLIDALGYQITFSANDGSMILTVDACEVEEFMRWRLAKCRYSLFCVKLVTLSKAQEQIGLIKRNASSFSLINFDLICSRQTEGAEPAALPLQGNPSPSTLQGMTAQQHYYHSKKDDPE